MKLICVNKIKRDSAEKITKRKSCPAVLGHKQKQGVDYEETFAPVVELTN